MARFSTDRSTATITTTSRREPSRSLSTSRRYSSTPTGGPGRARKSDRGFEQKYSREENPTVRGFEKVIAKLEKAPQALAFNSGMGSIAAVYLSALSAGDTMVITKESYGTTQDLALNLSKFGVKTVLAGPETDDFLEKIKSRSLARPRRDHNQPSSTASSTSAR